MLYLTSLPYLLFFLLQSLSGFTIRRGAFFCRGKNLFLLNITGNWLQVILSAGKRGREDSVPFPKCLAGFCWVGGCTRGVGWGVEKHLHTLRKRGEGGLVGLVKKHKSLSHKTYLLFLPFKGRLTQKKIREIVSIFKSKYLGRDSPWS